MQEQAAKPCVHIRLVHHALADEQLREVQAGLEEEGIPWRLLAAEGGECSELGHQAAASSQLGVGIGIHAAGLCIHYQKLPQAEPLFYLPQTDSRVKWRQIGSNAARLVKGIPFKTEQVETSAVDEQAEMKKWIETIVSKVLAETGKAIRR